MKRPGLVDQKELGAWADAIASSSEFPRLVRRLILETTPGLVQLGMPAGEGTSIGGWDGTVRSTEATAYVPEGLSLWELSTNKRPGAKADADYEKRTTTPDDSPAQECEFVAASLRRWADRDKWAAKRSKEGRWKHVRAYGLDEIEAWLETAPVTWTWISEQLGLHPLGLRSAESWWNAWSHQTNPPMTPELLIAARQKQVDALKARLLTDSQITTIGGPSLDEIRAFVAAFAAHLEATEQSSILARMALVDDKAAWRELIQTTQPLILIPLLDELISEVPSDCAHHILVPVTHTETADLNLEPLDAGGVTAALRAAGLDDEKKADAAGRLARQSLTALRRHLAANKALHMPPWAAKPVPRAVRAALLAGSWSDNTEADRSVLRELGGHDYEPLLEAVLSTGGQDDPLVIRVGDSWHLVSPVDAWLALRSQMSEDDLKRFENAVRQVLGEMDPALQLPQQDRWKASLDGKIREHSSNLRRGLAKSLALLGVHGSSISASHGTTGVSWASYLVRELLEKTNEDPSGRSWSSISDSLPLLAEAAPDAFIEAVRAGLSGSDPPLKKVFTDQEADPMFSAHSPPTDLLWALENLAWSEEHFGAAVDLLASLDAIDPGGRQANRPAGSLAAIFCPWHPENSVTPERRLAALDGLRRRHADSAWKLMMSMLPEFQGVHLPSHTPVFRNWKPPEKPVTTVEYFGVVAEVVTRVIEDAGIDADRWRELLENMTQLSPEDRSRVVDELETRITMGGFNDDSASILWRALRDLVGQHKEFSDAAWALPTNEVERLDKLSSTLTPTSAYISSLWLFEDHMPNLGDHDRRQDRRGYEAALNELRREAVAAIDKEGGLELVQRLVNETEVSWSVGIALAEAVGEKYDNELLSFLSSENNSDIDLAGNYFARRFSQEGWSWLRSRLDLEDATPLHQARLLLATRDYPKAWEVAEELGAEQARYFWTHFVPYGLGHDFQHLSLAATRMMDVDRNAAALDFIGIYMRDEDSGGEFADLVARGLEGLLSAGGTDKEIRALSQHDFKSLLSLLERNRSEVGEDRVGQLEWALLPALGLDPELPILHDRMATNPSFYVEVISTVYKPHSSEPEEHADLDQEERQRLAANAYHLLSSWRRPPGLFGGKLDREQLRQWIEEVTPLLIEADRYEVGLVYLGKVLVSAPADDDGSWPPEVVRELLEEWQRDEIESGLRTEIFNSRGVTSRGLEEGGVQERELVTKYRKEADQFKDRWPRTASILRSVATSYENEARRNENSAERFRRGIYN